MRGTPKRIVQAGYDNIVDEYAAWSGRILDPARDLWTTFLLENLPPDSLVLDLGCGNGLPSTRDLARKFKVTGVDVSARQLEAAQRNVPGATFVLAEMAELDLPPESFAAVTAFYSIIHLPREEHPLLMRRIATWLKSGGYLVAVMGASDSPGGVDPDWLGAPMYWSHYASPANVAMIEDAGLEIVHSSEETLAEDGEPVTFLWIVARKPQDSPLSR